MKSPRFWMSWRASMFVNCFVLSVAATLSAEGSVVAEDKWENMRFVFESEEDVNPTSLTSSCLALLTA